MIKALLREGFRWFNGAQAMAALPFASPKTPPSVWLGGARSGSEGGPLVKAQLLRNRFGDQRFGYAVLYTLSNALYLPDLVLKAIKARNIPIVLNQNGVFYPAWYPSGWERQNAQMAQAYQLADYVFWQSEFCRKSADKFLGVRRGGGEILYNAVDTDHFTPANTAPTKSTRILVTGKFGSSTAYRLSSSVAGLAECRRGGVDATLTIAGAISDDVLMQIRQEIAEQKLEHHVEFLGAYSTSKAPEIYRQADIYLMTKHNDPCPNVVLEALASGLPVLYSNSGGVPELVGNDAGVGLPVAQSYEKVSVPTPIDIAQGVSKILTQHSQMSSAARERAVNHFGLEAWLRRHEQVFTAILCDGKIQ